MRQELKDRKIILFDGECNLCNGSVVFVVKRDKKGQFLYSHTTSDTGVQIREEHDIPEEVDSILLYENGKVHTKSTAALRIAKRLDGIWPVISVFLLLPKPFRDFFYDIIARNRYKWFGKKDQCMIPTEAVRKRFV